MKRMKLIMILLFVLALISCGSGGSGEENTGNETIIDSNNDVNDVDDVNDDSNIISDADVEPPTAPYVMAISISSSEIALSWQASTDNISVSGYKVYRNGSYLTSVNTIAINDAGLTAETYYCYSVSAFDSAGNESDHSYQSCTWTSPVPIVPDTESPAIPTNLTAIVVSSSEIQLSWTASTDNVAVSGYKIYRDGNYLNFTTSTSANDTGLTGETQYCYSVSAVDSSSNESAQTDQICATTPQTPWQTSVNTPNAIVKDNSGNFYVAGAKSTEGGASLEKFDNAGIKKWHIDINSAKYIVGIASDGVNVYVYWVDENYGFALTSDKAKAYVSAYDSNGNDLWETEVLSSYAHPNSIAVNVNSIYISASNNGGGDGNVVKKLDFSGSIVNQVNPTISDFSNITTYNGYVYCVGHNANSTGGYINLVKYDADLNQVWQTTDYIIWQDTLDSSRNYDFPNSIAVDTTGIYLGGYVWTPADNTSHRFLAVHYDDAGLQLWNVVSSDNGGGSGIEGGAIAIDENNIYLAIGNNGSSSVKIIALSKNNGSEFWRSQNTVTLASGSPIAIESSIISDGVIFIPDSSSNKIIRFNTSTGEQIQ